MTPTTQKNGPASAGTDPDLGSIPTGNQEMNMHAPTTIIVPFQAQTPFNEYYNALIHLRMIGRLFEERKSLDAEEINDLQTLLYEAMDTLEPVGAYLDEIEYEDGHQSRFIECRRNWYQKRAEGKA